MTKARQGCDIFCRDLFRKLFIRAHGAAVEAHTLQIRVVWRRRCAQVASLTMAGTARGNDGGLLIVLAEAFYAQP